MSIRANAAAVRTTPHRELELIAIVTDESGTSGICVAATISTKEGMRREVFAAGETPAGLIAAIREIADWMEREYVLREAA